MEFGIPFTIEYGGTASNSGTVAFNTWLDAEKTEAYILSEVQGLDGASLRALVEDAPQRPGAFVFPSELGASYPGMTGYTTADTPERTHIREQKLRNLANSLRRVWGMAKWTQSDGTALQMRVSLAERLSTGGNRPRTFLLPMVSDAAYKESQEQHTAVLGSGDTTVLTNAGDADSYPTLSILGTYDQVTIYNAATGVYLILAGDGLDSPHTIEVDCLRQTVYLDGDITLPRYGDLTTRADFITLVPGDNPITVTYVNPSDGPNVTFTWRDSFS